MPDNELALMEWQVGTQADFDTGVIPTEKLMAIESGTLVPVSENAEIAEERGNLAPAYTVTHNKRAGSGKLTATFTYEQAVWFLDSLLGKATPTDNLDGTYTRVWKGIVDKPTPRILSLVHGSAAGTYRLVGGIANQASFKQEANAPLQLGDIELIGKIVEASSLATLADSEVTVAHANQAVVSIDDWGGSFGATPLAVTLFSYELGMNANRAQKFGIGSDAPVGWQHAGRLDPGSNQLKLAMELDTQSKAWFDAMLTDTEKLLVQIKYTLGNSELTVKFAGFTPEIPEIFTDKDGVAQVEMTLNALYNTGLGSWMEISLRNSVADF